MSEERLPRGFESPYTLFLWKELGIIRELERAGQFYRALRYSTTLLKYLSPELRKKLGDEGHRIMATVDHAVGRVKAADWFIGQVIKNRVAERLGRAYLEEFIAMLSDEMGERMYMEKPGRRISRGRFEEKGHYAEVE